jgi:hypothetical protein
VSIPRHDDPDNPFNPPRVVRCTGLDPADPIKFENPEVPVHDQQVVDSLNDAFVDRYDPTVLSGEQHFNPGVVVRSAPFYDHNEAKVRALQAEGIRLDDIVCRQRAHIHTLDSKIEQLSFLLSQAPIRTAPVDLREAAHSVTKYAYINRLKFLNNVGSRIFSADGWKEPWYTIAPSPTKWVLTDLLPLNTVIYTPNAMPGTKS